MIALLSHSSQPVKSLVGLPKLRVMQAGAPDAAPGASAYRVSTQPRGPNDPGRHAQVHPCCFPTASCELVSELVSK